MYKIATSDNNIPQCQADRQYVLLTLWLSIWNSTYEGRNLVSIEAHLDVAFGVTAQNPKKNHVYDNSIGGVRQFAIA